MNKLKKGDRVRLIKDLEPYEDYFNDDLPDHVEDDVYNDCVFSWDEEEVEELKELGVGKILSFYEGIRGSYVVKFKKGQRMLPKQVLQKIYIMRELK